MDGSPKGARFRDVVEDPRNTIITSPVTVAEVASKFLREGKDVRMAFNAVENNSTIPPVGLSLAKLAGEVHAEEKRRHSDFGLADAFVLATARNRSSRVLTGDPHFKGLPETVMI